MLDGVRLTGRATSKDAHDGIVLAGRSRGFKGLVNDESKGLTTKIILKLTVIDEDFSFAGRKKNTCNGCLSLSNDRFSFDVFSCCHKSTLNLNHFGLLSLVRVVGQWI